MNGARLRLGFPVKVMGEPKLKSNDARRWANNPHLKVSLEYVDAIFDYLGSLQESMDASRCKTNDGLGCGCVNLSGLFGLVVTGVSKVTVVSC